MPQSGVERIAGKRTATVGGSLTVGGQTHFYLENPVAIAIPTKEKGEMTVYAAGQAITRLQGEASLLFV